MLTIRSRRIPGGTPVLVLVAAALFGPYLDNYVLSVLSLLAVYVVFAVGYNLLMGVAGQFDFGQGAFLGIGAYSFAILGSKLGLSFLLALPLAGAITVVFGLLIGCIVLRLGGFYLALVTLGFNQTVVLAIALSTGLTGGYQGLSVTGPTIAIIPQNLLYFYIVVLCAVLFAQGGTNLLRSRIGLAFQAMRERDVAAQAMGVNLIRYRIMAYGLSAFYDGIAGALMGMVLSYITPEQFGLVETLKVLTMITVGGMGSVAGSVIGATALTLAGEALRASALFLEVGNGLLLMLFIMLMPGGIYGFLASLGERWRFSRSKGYVSDSAG